MSDLGNLSQCIVDNDPEVRVRARCLRRKALVASVCVEALCVGAMLLWPLVTPGVLPTGYIVTPVPPYHGGGGKTHPASAHHPPAHRALRVIRGRILYPSPNARSRPQSMATDDAPSLLSDTIGSGRGPDGPPGLGIPGGGEIPTVLPPKPAEPVRAVRQKMSEGVMEGSLISRVNRIIP